MFTNLQVFSKDTGVEFSEKKDARCGKRQRKSTGWCFVSKFKTTKQGKIGR